MSQQMQPRSAIAGQTGQLFLHVPEIKLPESSGRRSRKSQLQSIVIDNENSMKSYVIHPRMLRNVQHTSQIFSEKFAGSRLQAELCSFVQCLLVHHGNPVRWHRLTNDASHHP